MSEEKKRAKTGPKPLPPEEKRSKCNIYFAPDTRQQGETVLNLFHDRYRTRARSNRPGWGYVVDDGVKLLHYLATEQGVDIDRLMEAVDDNEVLEISS